MEVMSREEIVFSSDQAIADHRRLRANLRSLPEGYPPAPAVVEESRASAIFSAPRHLLGAAAIALLDVRPLLRQLFSSRRRRQVQATPSRLNT